jgi:KDO2-lipid IV(A) lauroyltransferase
VWRLRRRHVERALARAGVPAPARVADAMYRSLGASALEFLWFAGRPAARADAHAVIEPEAAAELARVRASGRGAVLAATHTGNWELAAFRLAEEARLAVVVKRQGMRAFDRFATRVRSARGVEPVDPTGALGAARARLDAGGLVAMLIDQAPADPRRPRALACEFLGALAAVDRAPAALALRADVPLLVTAAWRDGSGTHRLAVLARFDPPPAGDADLSGTAVRARAWVDRVTVGATRALDAFVRTHPEAWLWLHRRWRVRPPAHGAEEACFAAGAGLRPPRWRPSLRPWNPPIRW